MMEDIYREALRLIEGGKRGALATIIYQAGSSPRSLGAQMVLGEDGTLVGSVGGGRLEAEVMEGAKGVMEGGKPQRMAFHLTGKDVADTDMICGGEVEVLIEPLDPEQGDLYRKLVELKEADRRGLLFTLLPTEGGPWGKALITEEGDTVSPLPDGLQGELHDFLKDHPELWQQRKAFSVSLRRGLHFFVEPIFVEPTLYLFGAGHVAQQIAPLAKMVGFRVVVMDDRPEFANPDRFPVADETVVEAFERAAERITVDESCYLVIVTRGHLHDYTVLKQFLPSPARYIGMIGSRRKRDTIYKKLREEGFSEEDLSRVHAPIGLDIGAETPEEIAVSIVAEMIKVRRSG